ncbi:hypothetical protein GCM10027072_54420 [Streptomyces bullii]
MGLIAGAAAAAVELPFTVLAGLTLLPVLAWPAGRRAVLRPLLTGARRLTEWERARLKTWLGVPIPPAYTEVRALRYVACRWALGLLGAIQVGPLGVAAQRQSQQVGVLVLSQYVEKRYATELLTGDSEGVGYLLKDRVVQVDEFLDALERVARGRAAFDPEVVRQLLGRTTHTDLLARLTARERAVLAEMAQGHTNAAIARRLHISQSAVEKHTDAIFDKLELTGGEGYSRRVLAVLRYLGS